MRTLLFVLLLAGFLLTFAVIVTQGWPPGSPISPAVRVCGFQCGGLSLVLASWIAYATWGRKRKTRHPRRCSRSSAPGFTLTELLAVLVIMLVVATVSIGTLLALSKQQGPDSGAAVLQAAIVGARSCAVSTLHKTRLVIHSDWKQDGSSVVERYEFVQNAWVRAPSSALKLPPGIYALKATLPSVPVDEKMHEAICAALTETLWSGQDFKDELRECFVQFTPEGTLDWDSFGDEKAVNLQLVLVTMGGGRVTAWSSYVINSNTGTRLVFE